MSAAERIVVGVLAMQGAFREHVVALRRLPGVEALEVRTPGDLDGVDAMVLPGGESTTIRKQLVRSDLYEPLRTRLAAGMPALGTCAGLIVLADTTPDRAPQCLGLLDIDVERNGFGRQLASFEATVTIEGSAAAAGGGETHGIFIRAPRITRVGAGVEVIARLKAGRHAAEPVAVRQGVLVGCTFHPELGDDGWLHELLVGICKEGVVGRAQ